MLRATACAACLCVQAFEDARDLFSLHRGILGVGGSEWPSFQQDFLELARPAPVAVRLRLCQRLMRSYAIFQQFQLPQACAELSSAYAQLRNLPARSSCLALS
jgi:hypothetical protein